MTITKLIWRQLRLVLALSFNKSSVTMNKTTTKIRIDGSNLTSKKHIGYSTDQLNTNVRFEILPTPRKSESDKKEYKVIRLGNGLTVCLVADALPTDDQADAEEEQDPHSNETSEAESESSEPVSTDVSDQSETDDDNDVDLDRGSKAQEQKMAAAALCVGVGSFSDPKEVPGMAHFLEHMVFMGSEKFPEENDFDAFISKRGGYDNASTDCETTTFYFECLERDFYTALDKFAQFFISPLMKRSSITREREAIDSEFRMALPSDTYRKEQLLTTFAREDTPVNSFPWGNLITLRDNISEDELYSKLHEFRKRHYSAHRMTLAVQARLPMDVLQAYVLDCFGAVPCNGLQPDDFKQYANVFDTPEFAKLYYVQPSNEKAQVELTWSLPPLHHKYKSKPHQYVSWLLGDEGVGGLLSYLRNKVWVLVMSTGNGESGSEHNSMYALFTINMTMTKDGLENLDEVIKIIFSYIHMLRKIGPQKRIYDEIKTINDTSFKFATDTRAVEVVEELVEDMQLYPPEDYIAGSEVFDEYDPQAIQMVLDSLVPDKMNVTVLTKTLPPNMTYDKSEKWFGTNYTAVEIPENSLKQWKKAAPLKEFSLPLPNRFVTQDFTILEEDPNHPDYPETILSTELVELWYRKDQKFKLPIAYYYLYLINPATLETPLKVAMMEFYIHLLLLVLVEEAYPAQVAELSYSFKMHDKGIVLTVSGYNEKLNILLELISKHIVNFKDSVKKPMFEAIKDKMVRQYHNSLLKPGSLGKDVRLSLLVDKYHSLVDKYKVASSLTFEDVREFGVEFTKNLYVKALVQGNVSKEHATKVVQTFVEALNPLPINPSDYPMFRVTLVPKGETFCMLKSFNSNDSNSVITNYYQSGPFSVQDSVIIEIIMLIIQEPLFDGLRTKEQLGYDVHCTNRETFGILGFSITVNAQATKNTTEHVDKRIEVFIKKAAEILKKMSVKSFERTKRDLINMKRCTDVHLKEEVNRNWSEIADDDYIFDRLKQEIQAIEQLTLKEVEQWWQDHTLCGTNCKKLSIQVVGHTIKSDIKQVGDAENAGEDTLPKLELNFLDYEGISPEESRFCVKDIGEYKQNLYLHPVVGNVETCIRLKSTSC